MHYNLKISRKYISVNIEKYTNKVKQNITYTVFQKKPHNVLHDKFGNVRRKIKIFAQNFKQKLLSTGQRKIYVN